MIHSDVCGPMVPNAIGGGCYVVSFIDDLTRFSFCVIIRNKSQVLEEFRRLCSLIYSQFDTKVAVLVSDNGGEYSGAAFKAICSENGITHKFTVPDTPQQNGVAERWNQTIFTKVRAIIVGSNAPGYLWEAAVTCANVLRNCSPTKTQTCTPWEAWFKKPPLTERLRVWGCDAYSRILAKQASKHAPRGQKLSMIGYTDDLSGYRLICPVSRKVFVRRDVEFFENKFSIGVPSDGGLWLPIGLLDSDSKPHSCSCR